MARAMKDSGIEWMGEIPQEWGTIAFWQAIDRMATGLNPRDNFVLTKEDPYYYVTIRNFKKGKLLLDENCDRISSEAWEIIQGRSQLQKGDILFASISEEPNAYILDTEPSNWNINESVFCIRIKPMYYTPRFFYYHLNDAGYYSDLRMDATGSTFQSIKQNKLRLSRMVLPPLSEQTRIANFLDRKCAEIDRVIAETEKTIEDYKALKQSIITEAVTKGVRGDRPMKDSGIEWVPVLPADWDPIPSKFLFRNSDERKHEDDALLTASQKHGIITQAEYMERENAKIVLANKGIEDWKHVEPYDFIISLRSFQGGLEMSETTGCITWHYIVLKPCKPIYSFYFKWLFKSEAYIKALQRTCNFIRDGQDLRYSNFVQVPLFQPSLSEQEEIAEYLNKKCAEIDRLIQSKQQLLEELATYKKSVIYEYVTGKKEVPTCQ